MEDRLDPYCGAAPLPGELWGSWNLDPFLLVAAVAMAGFCLLTSSGVGRSSMRAAPAVAAALVLLVAFVSPLCALSSALFSARVFHHVLLVAVAAPLLAMAFPAGRPALRIPAGVVFVAHTFLLWFWHAPAPYAFALSGHSAYWLMEGSLFVSALLLWQRILADRTHPATALSLLLGSLIQMGMLGALLTFAREPLFEPHFATTLPYGLTPLADQQLAGLIMWVPSALPYLLAALVLALRLMAAPEATRKRA